MPTVSLSVIVPANADAMWDAVCQPGGFRFVSRGLVSWAAASHRHDRWREGETVSGWMFAAGFLPVSFHTLTFDRLDDQTRQFRTHEYGGIIKQWKHSITVTPVDGAHSRVDDSVTFSGGLLTPALHLAVVVFYLIRKPRWAQLANVVTEGAFRP